MASYAWYALAALGEISGCFAFWIWLRSGKSVAWTLPGILCLVGFAVALTRVEVGQAGRVFAAYGGVYILASFIWLWCVEGIRPDRWDTIGAMICLVGSMVILLGPRGE